MFSQDDESTGVALGVVFGVIFLVISLVVGLSIYQKNKSAKMAAATVAAAAPAATPAAPAAADSATTDGARVVVEGGVVKFYFASGKADIAQDGGKALTEILASAKTGKKVGISGFVDPSGNAQQNAVLAKKRAFAVRDLLLSSGVPEAQIVLVRPSDIKAGATTAAEGRRVEVFTL
jgi:outer membrane protein OmpA-like peptidoglycan-associated protein